MTDLKTLGKLPMEAQVGHLARSWGVAVHVFQGIRCRYYLQWSDTPPTPELQEGLRQGWIYKIKTIAPKGTR